MKYIKLFEKFVVSDDIEIIFKDRIDWELIENIKEMSLEYLDDDFILGIYVIFRPSNHWSWNDIFVIRYSHIESKSYYRKINIPDNIISNNPNLNGDINYIFYLFHDRDSEASNHRSIEKTQELYNRFKTVYNRGDVRSSFH